MSDIKKYLVATIYDPYESGVNTYVTRKAALEEYKGNLKMGYETYFAKIENPKIEVDQKSGWYSNE